MCHILNRDSIYVLCLQRTIFAIMLNIDVFLEWVRVVMIWSDGGGAPKQCDIIYEWPLTFHTVLFPPGPGAAHSVLHHGPGRYSVCTRSIHRTEAAEESC